MENENQTNYDGKKFAELTNIAMARQTPSLFARKLQIPEEYLTVLLSGKSAVPPSLDLIEKIARASFGKITFRELADITGYSAADAFPKKERLSECMGTWEARQGRFMNEEALQGYLKRMTQQMTTQDMSNPFEQFGTDSLDYNDFMAAAGYGPGQCRILRKKDLKPDRIKIPEELLKKKAGVSEEKTHAQKAPPETASAKEAEVTPYDLAELAILRHIRKRGDVFFIEGRFSDELVIKLEAGDRFLFDLSLAWENPPESAILAVYKKCATLLHETYRKYYLVFTNENVLQSFKDTPMANLKTRPSALLVSGARIIREEEL